MRISTAGQGWGNQRNPNKPIVRIRYPCEAACSLRCRLVGKMGEKEMRAIPAITGVLHRAAGAGIDVLELAQLSDDALEERLYGARPAATAMRLPPDPVYIHTERRKPGVTLELLHLEHLEKHADGCRVHAVLGGLPPLAEAAPADDAPGPSRGREAVRRLLRKTPHIVDPKTGEFTEVECSSPCSGPRTTPTPRRCARSRRRTESRATYARWRSWATSRAR
jgi:hypothetical protein